jgi:hypothetical protein
MPALQMLRMLYIINKVFKESPPHWQFLPFFHLPWIRNVNLSAVKGTREWVRLDEQAACSALGTATREIIGAGVITAMQE